MKILVLTSTYARWENDTDPGFVNNLCQYLQTKNEIHVVAPHTSGTPTREVMNEVRVFRFRYFIERWQTLAYDGGILPRIKQNKFRALLIPFFILGQLLLTVRLLRANNYDVIHAHWIIPQGLVALLARALGKGRPVIVTTSHGGDLFALKGRLLTAVKRWITGRTDHLTVVSSTMKSKAVAQGLKSAREISVIPMGVDSRETFVPPADPGSRQGLLFVGRLVDKKGVEYLIQAMPAVLERNPQQVLTIIGDGPLRNSLVASCQTLGIESQVNFLGSLVNDDIPGHLRAAAITIFPSVVTADGDQEGTPVAIMEALACECATIVSDYPGARDIIEDGVNGCVVAQRSPDQIEERINFLLESSDSRAAMGVAARHSVQKSYDWQVIGGRFEALFGRLVQQAGEPAAETDSAG